MNLVTEITQDETSITTAVDGGKLIIRINGTLNSLIRDEFRKLYHDTPLHREYELILENTDFIDSSGLGMLIALYGRTKAVDNNIGLKITGCSAALKQILTMSKFENFFEIL